LIKYTILLDIVGLEYNHLNKGGLLPTISSLAEQGESANMEPVFPAVTCPVQASLLSGSYPEDHGIIANGIYDRDTFEVSFWEQPSSLVKKSRIWDIAKQKDPSLKTAVLFWQNSMYANSDVVVTPRPIHAADGRMILWCYSKPVGYYEQMKASLGEFNLADYWGPLASSKASEWIASAAEYTLENQRPNLMFVYIPHVDYSAQRFGKNSPQVVEDLKKADSVVSGIVQKTKQMGIADQTQFLILSEYGFNDVRGEAIPLNVHLRDVGLLSIREIAGKEYIDYEHSRAFAMVDHQVAHIYVKNGYLEKTGNVLERVDGIDKLLFKAEKKLFKVDSEMSGDIIAISDRDRWFSYYWWNDSEKAPDFARTVDIHRKPGYDPVELFFDPKTRSIPFQTNLVKGSHGRPVNRDTGEGLALYISSRKGHIERNSNGHVDCTDVGRYLAKQVVIS
jgi:predicted AlkP superfamily pyrophosphatase or phosphodiesterase